MNIRYGAICEINAESQMIRISDILIYISITDIKNVKISSLLKETMNCMTEETKNSLSNIKAVF